MEVDCNLEEVCLMKVGCIELLVFVNVIFLEREFFVLEFILIYYYDMKFG